jgi:hypothetical protein
MLALPLLVRTDTSEQSYTVTNTRLARGANTSNPLGLRVADGEGFEPPVLNCVFLAFAYVHFQILTQTQTVLDIGTQGYLQGYLWPS